MLVIVVECFWLEIDIVSCFKMIFVLCLRMASGWFVMFVRYGKEFSVRVCSCFINCWIFNIVNKRVEFWWFFSWGGWWVWIDISWGYDMDVLILSCYGVVDGKWGCRWWVMFFGDIFVIRFFIAWFKKELFF